ncbi:MAG: 4Fe-4S binding protein, partial [Chloroflexi bacterium]|nr:4Fe-4S binding protein [Chloroflexota bacterium]
MADGTTFKIDGRDVVAKPGQTILQAAMDQDIYIPYLCYYPKMKPQGSCRACMVEVEANGRKMTVASCTTPPMPDAEVTTNSEDVQDLRRNVIELLMTEHPHGCLTCHRIELCGPQDICQRHVTVTDRCTICPKNERCELKDTVRMVELDLRTPLNYHRRDLPIHSDDPFYDRDYNLCIVCSRCVRVCDEVRFDTALTLTSRSGVALVGTAHGTSLLESGCEFCGACVDVCPTGSLTERNYKWEKAVKEVTTVCTNCPVGCQMIAEVNKFGK